MSFPGDTSSLVAKALRPLVFGAIALIVGAALIFGGTI